MPSLILRTATPILMMLLVIFSIYSLLRGHNEPGGGFLGGLLAAAAFSLHALSHDVPSTRKLLRIQPHTLIGMGLIMIVVSGLVGLVTDGIFLQAKWTEVLVPGVGMVHVGTPLLFDIGVYSAVMGVVLIIILAAAEE